MTDMQGHSLTIGILTYGDRVIEVEAAIRSIERSGIMPQEILVVTNGCTAEVVDNLKEKLVNIKNVAIHNVKENRGSSGGYAEIISYFKVKSECEWLMLLDDDNRLVGHHGEMTLAMTKKRAFFVPRLNRNYFRNALNGSIRERKLPPKGSFLHFDVFRTSGVIISRVYSRKRQKAQASKIVPILAEGPYSGLCMPRPLLCQIAPPRSDFFLYADDLEFTRRISHSQKGIDIIRGMELIESEASWNAGASNNNFLLKIRKDNNSFRSYYATRNRVYLDFQMSEGVSLSRYYINRTIYLTCAFLILQADLYKVFRRAISDGEIGALGETFEKKI